VAERVTGPGGVGVGVGVAVAVGVGVAVAAGVGLDELLLQAASAMTPAKARRPSFFIDRSMERGRSWNRG
jgi:hypothetical protein